MRPTSAPPQEDALALTNHGITYKENVPVALKKEVTTQPDWEKILKALPSDILGEEQKHGSH